MAARKLSFLQGVANEYREECPELSRIMMMRYFERRNGANVEDLGEHLQGNEEKICEHCGTVFTATNCTFRIKPKRKRKKKKKRYVGNDDSLPKTFDIMPKSTNFLQIFCHFCGWKKRRIGAKRDTRRSSRDINGSPGHTPRNEAGTPTLPPSGKQTLTPNRTPKLSSKKGSASQTSGQLQHSLRRGSGNKGKAKSRLKELLAKEKSETDRKSTSPSLINFLDSI